MVCCMRTLRTALPPLLVGLVLPTVGTVGQDPAERLLEDRCVDLSNLVDRRSTVASDDNPVRMQEVVHSRALTEKLRVAHDTDHRFV